MSMAPARQLAFALTAFALLGVASAASASASTPAPAWSLHAVSTPTNISPTRGGSIVLLATNRGAQPTDGSPVTISDELPAGLTVTEVLAHESPQENEVECTHTTGTVTCTSNSVVPGSDTDGVVVQIKVAASVTGSLPPNVATVVGGGATQASTSDAFTVSSSLSTFGLHDFGFERSDGAGSSKPRPAAVPAH